MAERRIAAATALLTKADAEGRDLTENEQREYDGHMSQADAAAKRGAEYRDFMQAYDGIFSQSSGAPPAMRPVVANQPPRIERRTAAPKRERAIVVPSTAEYRAQAEGSDPAGGFLVPVEQSPVVVERLAPESVVLTAGPRLFTMHSDEMRVPKVATGAVVGMVAENAAIPEGNIIFAAAALVARKLAALVRASNEWLNDAIPDAREVVEEHLLREMAIELDDQFFNGNGTPPNLLGILNWPGVVSTPGTASLTDIAAAIGRVEAAYATPNAIFISPANWAAIRSERDGGATGGYVLQPDAAAATRPVVFGVPVYVSGHVGTSIVVADMKHVAVGVRDKWTVHYDPYRYSEYDQSAIRVTSRWAIAPLHTEAVQVITTGALAAADADKPAPREDKPAPSGAAKK